MVITVMKIIITPKITPKRNLSRLRTQVNGAKMRNIIKATLYLKTVLFSVEIISVW